MHDDARPPIPWGMILAGCAFGAACALLLFRDAGPRRAAPGAAPAATGAAAVRTIRTHGSPDAPLEPGADLDFGEFSLALEPPGTTETPLPTRGADPLLTVPFALKVTSRADASLPLTHLTAQLLDGAGGAVPSAPDLPGLFLDTGETRLVAMRANIPSSWKRRLVHVDWVGPAGDRVEAYLRLR